MMPVVAIHYSLLQAECNMREHEAFMSSVAYLQWLRPFVAQVPNQDDSVDPMYVLCLHQKFLHFLDAAVHIPNNDYAPLSLKLAF